MPAQCALQHRLGPIPEPAHGDDALAVTRHGRARRPDGAGAPRRLRARAPRVPRDAAPRRRARRSPRCSRSRATRRLERFARGGRLGPLRAARPERARRDGLRRGAVLGPVRHRGRVHHPRADGQTARAPRASHVPFEERRAGGVGLPARAGTPSPRATRSAPRTWRTTSPHGLPRARVRLDPRTGALARSGVGAGRRDAVGERRCSCGPR